MESNENELLDELKYYLDTLSNQINDASEFMGEYQYLRIQDSLNKCHQIHEILKDLTEEENNGK